MEAEKNTKKFADGKLDTIIIHYTAGPSAENSARHLARTGVQASAHLVIGRQGGLIYQLVPFDTVSWHAGRSRYGHRTGFNQYSIGIELDNAGLPTKAGNEYQAWGRKPSVRTMKEPYNAELLPEYDFSGGVRGKHYRAYREDHTVTIHRSDGTTETQHYAPEPGMVVLDPDVQAHFPDSESVNRALRRLIRGKKPV